MATFSKVILSGSTNNKPILVVATATVGTAIHTTGATDLDEIWIWAHNTDGTDRKLTIEFGGVAAKDTIELTIPAESGLVPVVQGIPMNGSAVVTAFAASASVIGIVGFVNRITA